MGVFEDQGLMVMDNLFSFLQLGFRRLLLRPPFSVCLFNIRFFTADRDDYLSHKWLQSVFSKIILPIWAFLSDHTSVNLLVVNFG